jgi:hypothetical protein
MPKHTFNGIGVSVRTHLQQLVEINEFICVHENPPLDWF